MITGYLQFANSDAGEGAITALSVLVCGGIVLWAWRSRHIGTQALVIAAGLLSLLALAGYLAAVRFEWCRGLFVDDVPLGIQVATLIPTALLGWLVWLGAYNWLASRVRSPRLIYVAVGLWLVEAAALADRLELSDGLIEMGDGNIWIDAALLLALMFVPVLLYDAVRRAMARELLP